MNQVYLFMRKITPELLKHRLVTPEEYLRIHKRTVENNQEYWESVARELDWFKPWEKVLDDSRPPFYKWFVGGELNASYLAVDRHAHSWRRNKVAIIWEGEPWRTVPKK